MRIDDLVARLRAEHGDASVPGFDPSNGNEHARVLFLLESPGPRAVASGIISLDNQDPSARNFRTQLDEAGLCRADIAIWNMVPWYVGTDDFSKLANVSAAHIERGAASLPSLLAAMPHLGVMCFVGDKAQRGARHIQHELLRRGIARIDLWHTSAQAMAGATGHKRWTENVAALRAVAKRIAR